MPVASNHKLAVRPIVAGVHLRAQSRNRSSTVGAVARDAHGALFLISAWHVFAVNGAVVDGDPVFQGDGSTVPVAHAGRQWSSAALDIAAARLQPNVSGVGHALGIGDIGAVVAPVVGMPVVKSGLATGVTEGVIAAVGPSGEIVVVPPPWMPVGYELTATGDSGALWLHRDSHGAVAFHRKGDPTPGAMKSFALCVGDALAALGLSALV